jgi:UDP-N-acetylglucosamine 2-epimerase (hydrolysing)
MKKIVFLTGTRADYGKIKSIIQAVEKSNNFEAFVYVTGMHLLEEYGCTYKQIINDEYENIYIEKNIQLTSKMDINLANTILNFSRYISDITPDFIVVHGDRIDALAASIVGILNNIRVIHIEGGELTGTVDDSIRHAITKMSHIHFVANEESKIRLKQLGEKEESICVIGSPDIDIMQSDKLPNINEIKEKYKIDFEEYAILMYHPVITELNMIQQNINKVIDSIIKSNKNYICIYPNNDDGSEIIIKSFNKFNENKNIMLFKSFPFEEFIVLLKHSEFIIGNSSAGIREACVYGIPSINIGTRQNKRFPAKAIRNIINVNEDEIKILNCINEASKYTYVSNYFGNGNSTELFMKAMENEEFTKQDIQKSFVDLDFTQKCIRTYINEVCF